MTRWFLILAVFFAGLAPAGMSGQIFGPQTAEEADGDGEEEESEVRLSAEDIPTPITDTEVGDWAEYAMQDGARSRLTVIERWTEHGDDHLIIQNKLFKKDRKKNRRKREPTISEETVSVKERVADARDLGPFDFVTASKILVDDQRVDAVVVNYVEDGKVVRQSYFSSQVPVYGLVRGVLIEDNKKTVVIRLLDYGQSGEDED